MKVGLYFGSFNPIHIGHLIVADAMLEQAGLDEIWMVISPQNPLKPVAELAPEIHRLHMASIAIANHAHVKATAIEFDLPKPSYTIRTLDVLFDLYPDHEFSMIMGTDNLIHFDKWKSYQTILEKIKIHVYTRAINDAIPEQWQKHPSFILHAMPLIDVSSTRIRNWIRSGKSFRYWVKDEVHNYIEAHQLYR